MVCPGFSLIQRPKNKAEAPLKGRRNQGYGRLRWRSLSLRARSAVVGAEPHRGAQGPEHLVVDVLRLLLGVPRKNLIRVALFEAFREGKMTTGQKHPRETRYWVKGRVMLCNLAGHYGRLSATGDGRTVKTFHPPTCRRFAEVVRRNAQEILEAWRFHALNYLPSWHALSWKLALRI